MLHSVAYVVIKTMDAKLELMLMLRFTLL